MQNINSLWRIVGMIAICVAIFPGSASARWITDGAGCKGWTDDPTEAEVYYWGGACQNGYMTGNGTLLLFKDGKLLKEHQVEMNGAGKATSHPDSSSAQPATPSVQGAAECKVLTRTLNDSTSDVVRYCKIDGVWVKAEVLASNPSPNSATKCDVQNINPGLIDKVEWFGTCSPDGKAAGFGKARFWNGDSLLSTSDGYFSNGQLVVGKKTPNSGNPQYCSSNGRCVSVFKDGEYRLSFSVGTSQKEGVDLYKAILAEIEKRFDLVCGANSNCSSSDIATNIALRRSMAYREMFAYAKSSGDFREFIARYSTNDPDALVPKATQIQRDRQLEEFQTAKTSSDFASFISKYENNDLNNLIAKAKTMQQAAAKREAVEEAQRVKSQQLDDFKNAKTANELALFISTYEGNDPNKLIGKAKAMQPVVAKREAAEAEKARIADAKRERDKAAREKLVGAGEKYDDVLPSLHVGSTTKTFQLLKNTIFCKTEKDIRTVIDDGVDRHVDPFYQGPGLLAAMKLTGDCKETPSGRYQGRFSDARTFKGHSYLLYRQDSNGFEGYTLSQLIVDTARNTVASISSKGVFDNRTGLGGPIENWRVECSNGEVGIVADYLRSRSVGMNFYVAGNGKAYSSLNEAASRICQ